MEGCHSQGAVVLRRAHTPRDRQGVVLSVKQHWDRVGQVPREHLFVWDTADGAPPADAQLVDTDAAFEELPWVHKAAIGDGAPCSYYSLVRVVDYLDVEVLGAMVVDDTSDAVWIVELIGTDKRCGLAAMRALYKLAFAGRTEMRAIVLHAVGGVKNFHVMQFYMRAGLMHPQALGKTNKDFAELAAGGLDVFSAADMQRLTDVAMDAGDPRTGDRPMFFNSLMYNAQMEVTGSAERTGTVATLCAERGEATAAPTAAAPMTEQQVADRAYLQRLSNLTQEELDFVRKKGAWPAIRTSRNAMAAPGTAERKKNDWHDQRSQFIIGTFGVLAKLWTVQFCPGIVGGFHPDTVMAALFDNGDYSWVKSTACVVMAVQQRYGMDTGTRTKVFTALMHLCEVKQYTEAKAVYVDWYRLSSAADDINLHSAFTSVFGTLTLALAQMQLSADDSED
jgi:hypothetical protein